MAFIISVAINVIIVLIFCLPIVILFETIWMITRSIMMKVFKVDWYTHKEKYEMGLIPKEYWCMYSMVKIKLEEEIHKNFEFRKKILKDVQDMEEVNKNLRESCKNKY